MSKAFAYIRVSGSGQVDGDGPDRQREKIKRFALQHGLLAKADAEELGEFFEEGISGTVDALDRPAFVNFLKYIDEFQAAWKSAPGRMGFVDFGSQELHRATPALIVERMDRLARDLMVQELLLAECKKRGIKVYAADQGALVDMANDGGDPTRTLIRQILGAVAQWEKSVIVLKLKAAKDKMRRETGRCEGPKPYGSEPCEAMILRYAISLKEKGHPYSHIAGSLNLSGYKTRTGKPWNKARVAHIFQQLKDSK